MRHISAGLLICAFISVIFTANDIHAQSRGAFSDAYGTIMGPGSTPRIRGKDYYISQQSNMAGRGDVNAGANPRGNVDVNPPGFIGDNPFGNSTAPNP